MRVGDFLSSLGECSAYVCSGHTVLLQGIGANGGNCASKSAIAYLLAVAHAAQLIQMLCCVWALRAYAWCVFMGVVCGAFLPLFLWNRRSRGSGCSARVYLSMIR